MERKRGIYGEMMGKGDGERERVREIETGSFTNSKCMDIEKTRFEIGMEPR